MRTPPSRTETPPLTTSPCWTRTSARADRPCTACAARLAGAPAADWRPAAGAGQSAALCPELRARLAAEGIEQVFLVQVTVLPELLAAAESPLPPADL